VKSVVVIIKQNYSRVSHLQIFRTKVVTVHVDGGQKYRLDLVVAKFIRRLISSKKNLHSVQYISSAILPTKLKHHMTDQSWVTGWAAKVLVTKWVTNVYCANCRGSHVQCSTRRML